MKLTVKLCTFLTLCLLASCGLISDTETEKMINGIWECVQYETEDGVRMKIKETVTYYADTHSYQTELKVSAVSPVKMNLATIKYSGTWSATKKELKGEIEKSSISISYNENLLSASDILMLRRDLVGEADNSYDGGNILSLTEDSMKLEDDEDGTIYSYKRIYY